MSGKKNVFRFLVWCIYTVAVAGCMLGTGCSLGAFPEQPLYYGLAGVFALTALAGGTAFLLRALAQGLTAYFEKRKGVRLMAEVAITVILLTVGLVFRVTNLSDVGDSGGYYEAAEVRMGQELPVSDHGAVSLYIRLLHLVFLFFGNQFPAGILLQIALQAAAGLLLMLSVRRHVGSVAALVFLGLMACAPFMIREALTLSPRMMYLFLVSAAGSAVMAGLAKRPSARMSAAAGFLSAALAYLDVAGVLLLLLSLYTLFAKRGKRLFSVMSKAGRAVCGVLGFAAGFLGCVLLECLTGGRTIWAVLLSWPRLFWPGTFAPSVFAEIPVLSPEWLFLLGLLGIGVFSFWFRGRVRGFGAGVICVCGVAAAMAFGVFTGEMPGELWLFLSAALTGVCCLEQCIVGGKQIRRDVVSEGQAVAVAPEAKEKPETTGGTGTEEAKKAEAEQKAKEEKAAAEQKAKEEKAEAEQKAKEEKAEAEQKAKEEKAEAERKAKEEKAEAERKAKEEKAEAKRKAKEEKAEAKRKAKEEKAEAKRKAKEEKAEKKSGAKEKETAGKGAEAPAGVPAADGSKAGQEETGQPGKKEIRYLENPLPLPKKHEKRVLDYDYPVADDDDFDIQ